jgi:hypothetical protein
LILAVAWGNIIQLYVHIPPEDDIENDGKEMFKFVNDGYYTADGK